MHSDVFSPNNFLGVNQKHEVLPTATHVLMQL